MAEGHREDENGREQRREKEKREGKELAQERAAALGVDAIFVLRLQHGESRFSLLFWRLTRLDPEHR